MTDKIKMLFLDNPEMTEQIEAFCQRDPLFSKVKLEFYETAHEIAQIVGYELYDRFEQRFGLYTARVLAWACVKRWFPLYSPKCPNTPTPTVMARKRNRAA